MNSCFEIATAPILVPGLAATGVDPIPYLVVAGILLLTGVLFLVIRALVRRKPDRED